MKITLSKSQWTNIGKQAGWLDIFKKSPPEIDLNDLQNLTVEQLFMVRNDCYGRTENPLDKYGIKVALTGTNSNFIGEVIVMFEATINGKPLYSNHVRMPRGEKFAVADPFTGKVTYFDKKFATKLAKHQTQTKVAEMAIDEIKRKRDTQSQLKNKEITEQREKRKQQKRDEMTPQKPTNTP